MEVPTGEWPLHLGRDHSQGALAWGSEKGAFSPEGGICWRGCADRIRSSGPCAIRGGEQRAEEPDLDQDHAMELPASELPEWVHTASP